MELHGFAHYPSSEGPREAHLYGDERAPGWLGKLPIATPFVFHNARKLFRAEPIAAGLEGLKSAMAVDGPSHQVQIHGSLTWRYFGDGDWPIVLSTPERAVLEVLDELPGGKTFHQVDMLMAGLVGLSPRRTSRLLGECRSVKVKRLYLWFAARHGHPWFERLDRDGIDLGRGKRMLGRGGAGSSIRNTGSWFRRTSMPMDERYRRQVELLVRTLHHVAQERWFAFFIVYLMSHPRSCWHQRAGTCAKSSSAVWPG